MERIQSIETETECPSAKDKILWHILKLTRTVNNNMEIAIFLALHCSTYLHSNCFEERWVSQWQLHHLFDLSQLFTAAPNVIIANIIEALLFILTKGTQKTYHKILTMNHRLSLSTGTTVHIYSHNWTGVSYLKSLYAPFW